MTDFTHGKIKCGYFYKGTFFEFGSDELKTLLLIDGRKTENKDTLLGLMSEIEIKDVNNLINKN